MNWGFSESKEMNHKYLKLCHCKCYPLHFSSWKGQGGKAKAVRHHTPVLGSAPLLADMQRNAETGVLILHSALYPADKDNLSPC